MEILSDDVKDSFWLAGKYSLRTRDFLQGRFLRKFLQMKRANNTIQYNKTLLFHIKVLESVSL